MYENFLAPIDEYSNLPFRLLCQKYGAIATCVPLVNSTAIARSETKISLVDANVDEANLGVQLVGNNPDDIGKCTKMITEKMPFVEWFNLNCGCPSSRTRGSGGGSALLDKPELVASMISKIKDSTNKQVSAKIRLVSDSRKTIKLCKMIENAGADFIMVHGRTAKQGYSGACNWDAIKAIKEHTSVPVVGNGDIKSLEHGRTLVESGYCDSYMVGRAAMTNPAVFAGKQPDARERLEIIADYIGLCKKYVGRTDRTDLKVKVVNFIASIPNASQLRNEICRARSTDQILEIVDRIG